MNKLILVYFSLLIFISTSCNSQDYSKKENRVIPSIIEEYIDFRNKKSTIDNNKNILVIGSSSSDDKNLNLSVYFINPQLLSDFKYSKVYKIKEYKMIIDESLDKSNLLQDIFKKAEIEYENFNLAKFPFTYNLNYWHIILNSKNEIVEILPQEKSEEIKLFLENKGLKFSKNYPASNGSY